MFSFKPLWKKLIDENMTRTQLRKKIGFSPTTLAKMDKKDEFISMRILHKICEYFDCQPGEIVEYIPDSKREGE